MLLSRKYLSATGLLDVVRTDFKNITIPLQTVVTSKLNPIRLVDCLMSGFAVFSLKFPSLLKFDESRNEGRIKHNLRTLYGVEQAPSDTYMRERCDPVEPKQLRKTFKKLFACIQRGKGLEGYEYLGGRYLVAGDGTGFFESTSVKCDCCCIKYKHKCRIKLSKTSPKNESSIKPFSYFLIKSDCLAWKLLFFDANTEQKTIDFDAIEGLPALLREKNAIKSLSENEKTLIEQAIENYHRTQHPEDQATYYHNMYCAAIVHPDKKTVIPFAPEPIIKSDGQRKNDCERNASKRLYQDMKREHPHLKLIVVEDSLASNYPHLIELQNNGMQFIAGAKPGDHQFLFEWVDGQACQIYQHQTEDGTTHLYRYINEAPLNKSHADFKVNFIEYWETDKKSKTQHFCWVTDIAITDENVYDIMRGGRVNWKVENGVFNTLKNQNYHFEHNFGHGYQNLSTVFVMLMMLAFFVDQAQEIGCQLFKLARAKFKSKTTLWERIRVLFLGYLVETWEDIFNSLIYDYNEVVLKPNSS